MKNKPFLLFSVLVCIVASWFLYQNTFAVVDQTLDSWGIDNDVMHFGGFSFHPDKVQTVTSTAISIANDTVWVRYELTTAISQTLQPIDSAVNIFQNQVQCHTDTLGNASTYNITLNPNGAETINGATTYVIDENYGSVCIIADDDNSDWIIVLEAVTKDPSFATLQVLGDTTANGATNNVSGIVPTGIVSTTAYYNLQINTLNQTDTDFADTGLPNIYGLIVPYANQVAYNVPEAWNTLFSDQSSAGTVTDAKMINIQSRLTASSTDVFTGVNFANPLYAFSPTSSYAFEFDTEWLSNYQIKMWLTNEGAGVHIPINLANDSNSIAYMLPMNTTITGVTDDDYDAFKADVTSAGDNNSAIHGSFTSDGLAVDEEAFGLKSSVVSNASDDADAWMAGVHSVLVKTAGGNGTFSAFSAVGASTEIWDLLIDSTAGANIEAYEPVNDANPAWIFGSGENENLSIQTNYYSGTQILENVTFASQTATSTADAGAIKFNVDGANMVNFDDSGVNTPKDVYVTASSYGIVLTSPDSSCARISIDNSDVITATPIACP
jgi:hypothetical protein